MSRSWITGGAIKAETAIRTQWENEAVIRAGSGRGCGGARWRKRGSEQDRTRKSRGTREGRGTKAG
jgi:hypothetical protein